MASDVYYFCHQPVNFLTVKALQRKLQCCLMKAVFVEISCVSKASKRCYITFSADINVRFVFHICVGTAMKVLCASNGLRTNHTPTLPKHFEKHKIMLRRPNAVSTS